MNILIKNDRPNIQIFDNIKNDLNEIVLLLDGNPVKEHYLVYKMLIEAVMYLYKWDSALSNAEVDSDRFKKAYNYHIDQVLPSVQQLQNEKVIKTLEYLKNIEISTDKNKAIEYILNIALPFPIFYIEDRSQKYLYCRDSRHKKKDKEYVAVVEFNIDGNNIDEPHVVLPNRQYDLGLKLSINEWPEKAEKIILQPVCTESRELYQIPIYEFIKNGNNKSFTDKRKMLMKYEQSFESDPLEFKYNAFFYPSNEAISVLGNNNLLIKCDNEEQVISGYKRADIKLVEIKKELLKITGITKHERENFMLLMINLSKIAGQALSDNIYTSVIDEDGFQKDIMQKLRFVSKIGSDLEIHPHAAAGITDLVFKKIIIELKFEDSKIVTFEQALNYSQQSSQYTTGYDNRLGIICILDCSKKDQAPGSLSNDVGIIEVPVPGGTANEFPLYLGVVILRGNLGIPSSLK
jgi:hypothetical protein